MLVPVAFRNLYNIITVKVSTCMRVWVGISTIDTCSVELQFSVTSEFRRHECMFIASLSAL